MRQFRHEALDIFFAKALPTWGADLSGIDFDEIFYYLRPSEGQGKTWDDVPESIKNTFERLGIPEAERKFLAGVGAQYDSEVVYHSLREEWEKIGVVFLDMDSGLREHEDIVREYFATVIPAADNKFAALNSAVWSGGSFVYVPAGVHVDIPLQAYFRINAENMGQFERTLMIVEEGASVHYVEGCTAPDLLQQQPAQRGGRDHRQEERALPLHDDPELEHRRLQPGDQAHHCRRRRHHGVDRRQSGQQGDHEVSGRLHDGPQGPRRNSVDCLCRAPASTRTPAARLCTPRPTPVPRSSPSRSARMAGAPAIAACSRSPRAPTTARATWSATRCCSTRPAVRTPIPTSKSKKIEVSVGHEASVSKIGEEQLFYLMSRGIGEDEAAAMIVGGFIEPLVKELPMEYAVEMNRLIQLQMEGSIG